MGVLLVDASLMGTPAAAPPAAAEEAATTTATTTVTTTTVTKTEEVPAPAAALPAPAMPPAPPLAVAKAEPAAPAPGAQPLLDVASLKSRLRETSAIGTLAKLSLRSQMEELVEQFRAYHLGGLAGGIASLRPPYDALVRKVLAAVREGDPALARLISESREALWQLLADPLRFDSVS